MKFGGEQHIYYHSIISTTDSGRQNPLPNIITNSLQMWKLRINRRKSTKNIITVRRNIS